MTPAHIGGYPLIMSSAHIGVSPYHDVSPQFVRLSLLLVEAFMGVHFEFIFSARTAPGAAGVVSGGGGYPRPQRQRGRDSAPPALRGGCWEKIMPTSVRSAIPVRYSSMILIIHCRFCHFSRGMAGGGGGGGVGGGGSGGRGGGGPPPTSRPFWRRGQPSAREHQKKKSERGTRVR